MKSIDDVPIYTDDPTTNDSRKILSRVVLKLMPISYVRLRTDEAEIGEVPVTNPYFDDPHDGDSDDANGQIMVANTQLKISSLLFSSTKFQFLQASSYKPHIDLDIHSYLEEMDP